MVSKANLTRAIKDALVGVDLAITGRRAIREKVERALGSSISDQKELFKELLQKCVSEINDEDSDETPPAPAPTKKRRAPATTPTARSAKKAAPVRKRAKKEKDPNAPPRKTGLSAPQILSDKMSALMAGEKQMSRPSVVKQLWVLIKERDLQDEKNKKNILCDEEFKNVFGVSEMTMFEMNKLLSNHVTAIPKDPNAPKKAAVAE
ncbi:hypothetical protein SARC_00709 [Sphaeroforma arctica JP610]|uniref:Uncharacterized protein n=1 Tax=Sphaeroforma arctica JP610 TaxID=667725 RepID=A0A0L0GE79_9EUKA|nr:hypothetical protein SARC_00709 [Sphaeroforma arctica JP610]KNC87181.1 hypothetical protein SARC_00709 [Sphaeroforma arctica JP610]|eukprot:XP_014161083.1 hypothetical protein SARC_00709 [Sphaeroforma arctica JP610]